MGYQIVQPASLSSATGKRVGVPGRAACSDAGRRTNGRSLVVDVCDLPLPYHVRVAGTLAPPGSHEQTVPLWIHGSDCGVPYS